MTEPILIEDIIVTDIQIGAPIQIIKELTNLPVTTPDTYTGTYEAIPKTKDQSFSTAGKMLTKDFKVKEIPYYEVSNPAGGTTFIIGGN